MPNPLFYSTLHASNPANRKFIHAANRFPLARRLRMCQMRTVGWLAGKPSYHLKDLFLLLLPTYSYSVQLSISQRRYFFIQLPYIPQLSPLLLLLLLLAF